MENPATHGEAERIVSRVLYDFYVNQEKALTDPDKVIFGPSVERQITDALREAGLLKDKEDA